jgi:hypothetical protein
VSRVHGLEHVENLVAANLPDDDPVRPHAERVSHELPLRHSSLALHVRGPRLQTHDVRLQELELGGILDRHDPLGHRNGRRERVEQRRLAGTGAAGDEHVQAGVHRRIENGNHPRADGVVLNESVHGERANSEPANGENRTVQGQRRDDRVDAGSVGESRVHHRRRLVHATTDSRDDPVDELHQVVVVVEPHVGRLEESEALDEYLGVGVHEDVRDVRIVQQRLDRTEPERLVEDLLFERVALGLGERDVLLREQLDDDASNLIEQGGRVDVVERGQIQTLDHPPVDAGLERVVRVAKGCRGRWGRRSRAGRRLLLRLGGLRGGVGSESLAKVHHTLRWVGLIVP